MKLTKAFKVLACSAILVAAVSTASAKLIVTKGPVFLPGVSKTGAPDWCNGNYLNGKIYNYSRLNLLVGTAVGKVTNEWGRVFIARDSGIIDLYDVEDQVYRVATSDVYVVGPRKGYRKAAASGVAVHNPRLAPPVAN